MASSRIPREYGVLVPEIIMELSRVCPEIHVNPPPEQRVTPPTFMEQLIMWPLLYPAMRSFLKTLQFPQPAALHFRDCGRQTGTAIIKLEGTLWTDDGDCRLDFKHPSKMKRLYGCPNFWSAFILAIMPIADFTNLCIEDPHGREFVKLCEVHMRHTEKIPTHLL